MNDPSLSKEPSTRIAVEQFDDSGWTGGVVYIQNLLKALSSLPTPEKPFTLLTRTLGDKPYSAVVDRLLEIPQPPRMGRAQRALKRVARRLGVARPIPPMIRASLMAEHVNVLFTHNIYPMPLGVPLIGWIPDFQYIHMPEISGQQHAAVVEQYHRDLIRQSSAMLVSSHDVLKDLKNFSAEAAAKAQVVQFVAYIPQDVYETDPALMCQKYSLPERYFFCPNQFWKHKNHLLVIKALGILRSRGENVTVVCTGTTYDDRNPNFFGSVLTEAALAGVHDNFRILGLVPRQDVYALNRQSLALLQPSLFEGWSTSIEEAKSLGKRVVASDLAVNIEQIPEADFFARNDAESLANCLERVAKDASPGPDLPREEKARAQLPDRAKDFARKFLRVVEIALGSKA